MSAERTFPVLALPAAILAACLAVASCGREGDPPSDQMVSIGSHLLQAHLEGKGAPAVVIDAGITDSFDKLRPLQERLARVTRVVTYYRAGHWQSGPGPMPRRNLPMTGSRQSRALAGRSANGRFMLAEGASHYLYLDVPELVARQILSVVQEVRDGKKGGIPFCSQRSPADPEAVSS